jgi:AraC-like DNA-binding protein
MKQHINQGKLVSKRNEVITKDYFDFLDRHLSELVEGKVTEMLGLGQIAGELCISHSHLIAVIRESSGNHPCHFFDFKILQMAKKLLIETNLSVAEIARRLTYDPSNFSKFFSKYSGGTPGQFRKKRGIPNYHKSSP